MPNSEERSMKNIHSSLWFIGSIFYGQTASNVYEYGLTFGMICVGFLIKYGYNDA